MSAELPAGPPSAALVPVASATLSLSAPRRLTPQYAAAVIAALGLLVPSTGVWVVGAIYAISALLLEGVLVPGLAIAATGFLLGRGWHALAQSVRARLTRPDLSESEALPEAYHALSPQLQRLVRHTRTVRAGIADLELDKAAVLRDVFEWVSAVAEIDGSDRETLVDRGLSAGALRAEVVALHERRDPRSQATDLLARFEDVLLETGGDPFRGVGSRRR